MPELSAAVRVCHTLAGNEAIKSNHEFITPAHLLWGITRLEAVNSAENAAKIGLSPADIPPYLEEVQTISELFRQFKLDLEQFRKELRRLIGAGNYSRPNKKEHISRSPECRNVYERATKFAETKQSPRITVFYLLLALLEEANIQQLLVKSGIDLTEISQVLKGEVAPRRQKQEAELENTIPIDKVVSEMAFFETKYRKLLDRISRIANHAQHIQALLERVIEAISEDFPGAERQTIALLEENELVPREFWPPGQAFIDFALAEQASKNGQVMHWVTKASDSEEFSFGRLESLYAPLSFQGELLGMLHIESRLAHFGSAHLQLLQILAGILAPAIKVRQPNVLPKLPTVFISYVREDRPLVNLLAADLRRRKIKVWYDLRLQVGENWSEKIDRAIQTSEGFILIMTELSVTSPYVLQELEAALRSRRPVLPLLFRDCQPPQVIEPIQRIKMSGQNYADGLEQLVRIVLRLPK